jgi:hypothetical protein
MGVASALASAAPDNPRTRALVTSALRTAGNWLALARPQPRHSRRSAFGAATGRRARPEPHPRAPVEPRVHLTDFALPVVLAPLFVVAAGLAWWLSLSLARADVRIEALAAGSASRFGAAFPAAPDGPEWDRATKEITAVAPSG